MDAQNPKRLVTLRRLQLLSAIVGLFIAGYLSYLKVENVAAVCVESGPFNCSVVLNSQYSELNGIPIAYLGFLVYALIALVIALENRIDIFRHYGRLIAFGIGLFAWLFSMWLVYVQFFLLEALCPWCLSHETNFTILFGLICYRLYTEMANASA